MVQGKKLNTAVDWIWLAVAWSCSDDRTYGTRMLFQTLESDLKDVSTISQYLCDPEKRTRDDIRQGAQRGLDLGNGAGVLGDEV